jgi:hypothetical protein
MRTGGAAIGAPLDLHAGHAGQAGSGEPRRRSVRCATAAPARPNPAPHLTRPCA